MAWEDYGRKKLDEYLRAHGQKAALARAIRVEPGTVSRWLAGEYPPNADQLGAICLHLGISADVLLGLEPASQTADEIAHRLDVALRDTQALTKLLIARTRTGKR